MDKVDVEEKKKMFDLMKDRELGGNMDWMYRGDKTDGEEFLLGKSVDKLLTEATTSAAEDGGTSIISERIKANVALDMQAKMREDPLFAIRKKEEEARRHLLENPVKMKQLERLVEQQKQQLKSKSSKKAKKEKKNKKKKKKSRGSDSDDSDSSESEDDLVNQYLMILTQKKKSGHSENAKRGHKHDRGNQGIRNFYHDRHAGRGEESHQHRDDHRQTHSGRRHNEDRDMVKNRRNGNSNRDSRQHSGSPPRQRKRDRSSSREPEPESPKIRQRRESGDGEVSERVYGLIKSVRHNMAAAAPPSDTKVKSKRYSSSPSPDAHSRSRSPRQQNHRKERSSRRSPSPPKPHKSSRRRSSSRSRSRSPLRKRNVSPVPSRRQRSKSPPRKRRSRSPPKKKLTAEEREKKLQEMMDNAKWRDEQRLKNVQRYKKEDEKESSRLSKYQGDAGFLSSMMSDHAANSSVEDRLKRNKYNIQRTTAALDKKFTLH